MRQLISFTVFIFTIFISLCALPCVFVKMCCLWFFTGLPPVLCVILWLLWQGEENRQCRVPITPCLLPGWNGCLCLQFHHSVAKVIIMLFKTYTDAIIIWWVSNVMSWNDFKFVKTWRKTGKKELKVNLIFTYPYWIYNISQKHGQSNV